jgi:septal ring factor EnvC (AmiA/AmiB activator)
VIEKWRWVLPTALTAGLMLLPAQLPAAIPEKAALDAEIADLATTRAQCIAAAHSVQQQERAVAALILSVGAIGRGAAAMQQQLDLNGKQEELLLGALERLTRTPPGAVALSERPIDRVRGGILIRAALPALQAQAKALSDRLDALGAEREQVEARRSELDAARQTLAAASAALTPLVGKRSELIAKLLPSSPKPKAANLGEKASDLSDLIKRADAENGRRGKELFARLRGGLPPTKGKPTPADPTRPSNVRALDAPSATMIWPVMGDIIHRFGETDRDNRSSQGVSVSTSSAALVVAPFDGQVEFAGNFLSLGLILIIRHGGGYHSLLAGLGQVDVTSGQWLLAGEPVGVMPGADHENASATFYLELHRDGHPVDPQSRLAGRE